MNKCKMKNVVGLLAGLVVSGHAFGALVARWDFNDYDPASPKSPNVLRATVGGDGMPCYCEGKGTATTDDINNMYVIPSGYTGEGDSGNMANAAAGLAAGNCALAIPVSSHVRLPIPEAVKDHNWTLQIRFFTPTVGKGKSNYRCFFNLPENTDDGDLFIRGNGQLGGGKYFSYGSVVSDGAWHTVTLSQGNYRMEIFLDEITESYYNGDKAKMSAYFNDGELLLCADDDGEDGLLYIDYVALYDEGGVLEAKLPHYSKAGLTGEWTFPQDENQLKGTVGRDLEKYTRTGEAAFTDVKDGVMPSDTGLMAGQNNGLKCYHGLTKNASYTVVMDVRVPDNENKGQWHALFQPIADNNKDCRYYLTVSGESDVKAWVNSQTYTDVIGKVGEWMRVAFTYTNDGNKILYVNGVQKNSRSDSAMKITDDFFYFLVENNGEDYDLDISYAAIYDRVLTADEIAELHARPLAQRADSSFITTVPPAGQWENVDDSFETVIGATPLTPGEGGAQTWTRAAAPASATYVFELMLPETQTEGGTLVKNTLGNGIGFYGTASKYDGSITSTHAPDTMFTTDGQSSYWGYWTFEKLDRTLPHKVAVTIAANGRHHYYVDGRAWAQLMPWYGNKNGRPTETMSFLNGLGAYVWNIIAYDTCLTPDEVVSLTTARETSAGVAWFTDVSPSATPTRAHVDPVTFKVTAMQEEDLRVVYTIDYGDGTTFSNADFVSPDDELTFVHTFVKPGTFTPRVRVTTQDGFVSDWQEWEQPIEVVSPEATSILKTWPWQQNVYTNRFTIMCETTNAWPSLEVQYGADYAERQAMTYEKGNGGTYIYKAHVTIDGHAGEEIPYRLGFGGEELAYETPEASSRGVVKLWKDEDKPFRCSIWGDNQEGARQYDWDSDRYAYVRALFRHMVDRDVDFGLSTGDMASSANYKTQIEPGILVGTDGEFGRVKPYYVAWGNHDTGWSANKTYFETPAVDEPAYGSSNRGNSYLYRNNVLIILLDNQLMNDAGTKTWLTELLATPRAKAAKFRIALQHYPLYGECWGSINSGLVDILKAGGVEVVFSGHMHGYERIEKNGILQITNGGAGYLDHVESIAYNYGAETKVGGHQNVPYLWARQKSPDESDVLGGAEPVRMGCIQSYGELSVDGDVMTYQAHGFNADGSYIGVFDTFAITSTVAKVEVEKVGGQWNVTPFVPKTALKSPINNTNWAEFKESQGESWTKPEGAAETDPVVNVSKTEIERFCEALNAGTPGTTYRLPTLGELTTIFDGHLVREVAEWTSSVDRNMGWCRILGSPAKAVRGTWARAEDVPSIATADCHADYLGFRLVTGAKPVEPVDPLAAPLAALAEIAEPAAVYKWVDDELVDISDDWTNDVSVSHTYDVPVVFTGKDTVSYTVDNDITFNAGFAAPNSSYLKFPGRKVTVKGSFHGGVDSGDWAWGFECGSLAVEGVTFSGQCLSVVTGDQTLSMKGVNDFSGAVMPIGNSAHIVNLVAAEGTATLKLRSIPFWSAKTVTVGAGVTLDLVEDVQFFVNDATIKADGTLTAAGLDVQANVDPWFLGEGTIRTTHITAFQNSYKRIGVANLVLTSANPWRRKSHKQEYRVEAAGETRIISDYPWTIGPNDAFGQPFHFYANTKYADKPKFVFAGGETIGFSPAEATCDLVVDDRSTVLIKKCPTTGETATTGDGIWAIDGTLAMNAGETVTGTFALPGADEKLTVNIPSEEAATYTVLKGSGLTADDLTVETSLDASTTVRVTKSFSPEGDVTISVVPAAADKTAKWTGDGDRTDPGDPDNWVVKDLGGQGIPGAIPDATTVLVLEGTTTLNVPTGSTFTCAGILCNGTVRLTDDCDWRGIPDGLINDAVSVDLHQYDLWIRGGVPGGYTDSTTEGGALHVDVAEGLSAVNACNLSGSLKLVKEGDGTLVQVAASTHTGGIEIAAGTLAIADAAALGSGLVTGAGTLAYDPGATADDKQIPAAQLEGFAGTLWVQSGRHCYSTPIASTATLKVTDGAQFYLTGGTWNNRFEISGQGWKNGVNDVEWAALRLEGGTIGMDGSLNFTVVDGKTPTFGTTSTKAGTVLGTLTGCGFETRGNGTIVLANPKTQAAELTSDILVNNGVLKIGTGNNCKAGDTVSLGSGVVVNGNGRLDIHPWSNSVETLGESDKVTIPTPITLNGGTLYFEDGSYVLSSNLTVAAHSTMSVRYKSKGRIFKSLKGPSDVTLTVVNRSGLYGGDGLNAITGGDFAGTIADKNEGLDFGFQTVGTALENATLDFAYHGKISVSSDITIGALNCSRNIVGSNNAVLTLKGGTVSGAISGEMSVVVDGLVTLTGANTYTGTTWINGILGLGTSRPDSLIIDKASTGTIRLTLTEEEKIAYGEESLAIALGTDATEAGAFAGRVDLFDTDGTTPLYGVASFQDVGGGMIMLVVNRDPDSLVRTAPFSLTLTQSTQSDWTRADWLDATTPTPRSVRAADWTSGVNASIAQDSDVASTLRIDHDLALGKLTLENAGTLTIDDARGGSLGNAPIDDSASTGKTTLDFATGAVAITAGADTILTKEGTGAITIGSGMTATVPNWSASLLSGAGTIAFHADAMGAVTPGAFPDAFTGDIKLTQGTWTCTSDYPRNRPLTVSGENATMHISYGDATGYSPIYPAITVRDGATLKFTCRDTFSRELHLVNGAKVQFEKDNARSNGDGRAIDFYNSSSLTVDGPAACTIGGFTEGTTTESGIVNVRRSGFVLTVNAGAELDVWSRWGYDNNAWSKAGDGRVTFRRTTPVSVKLTVSGGTVRHLDGGQSTAGEIALASGTTLELEDTDGGSYTLANAVSGTGSLVKKGSGTYVLSGTVANTLSATVEAGTLDIGTNRGLAISGAGSVAVTLTDAEIAGGTPIPLFTGSTTVSRIVYDGEDITAKCTVESGTITRIKTGAGMMLFICAK